MSLGEFLKIHKKLQNEKALHFYGTCTSFTPLLVFGLKEFSSVSHYTNNRI